MRNGLTIIHINISCLFKSKKQLRKKFNKFPSLYQEKRKFSFLIIHSILPIFFLVLVRTKKERNMPNPNCEKCKPDKVEDHPYLIQKTGCQESYSKVDLCMKEFQGNISSCREEWKVFQECLKKARFQWLYSCSLA